MRYPKVSIYRYKSGDFRVIYKFHNSSKVSIIMKEDFEKMKELDVNVLEGES